MLRFVMLPEEWRMYSRAVPAFRNITGVLSRLVIPIITQLVCLSIPKHKILCFCIKNRTIYTKSMVRLNIIMKKLLYQLQFPKLFVNLRFCVCERTAVVNDCIRVFSLFRYRQLGIVSPHDQFFSQLPVPGDGAPDS